MTNALTVSLDGKVAVLEFHRPPVNFFDRELLSEIADAAAELADGDTCRALVLCSEGKHFCAGANFGEGGLGEERAAASRAIYTEAVRLFEIGVPVVAAVQGSAVGGGLGLACSADFRVAAESSRFHANFSALGFHQGFGLSVSLPRIVGEQTAADLLYTSRRLTGSEAHAVGLVDRLAEEGEIRSTALELAHRIAANAPLAVQSMKATLRAGLADQVRTVLERELSEQTRLWATEDSAEGVRANLARETAVFHGR
ncbi:enoyl-CoA hydratase/isomerase family protein [Mumia sp. DW29H23]|uniref:enoyl-CoA hydratase/isomerase family protein n=1 Tax=Mumia sp. DW29H23 TaxID=3421241 RepID=UPI003D688232